MHFITWYTDSRLHRWGLISAHAGILLLAAYILTYGFKLTPCPLCLLQQWLWWPILIFALLATLLNKRRWYQTSVVSVGGLFLLGLLIASRHIWLQFFAGPNHHDCGLPLSFMLENLPWYDTLILILQGSEECHKITWSFLGLTLPMWSWLNYACGLIMLWADIYCSKRYS